MSRGLPILMYHRVVSDACPAPDPEEARYGVDLHAFASQLDQIREAGYRGVSVAVAMEDLRRGVLPEGAVVLTFDDGNRSDYVHATPLIVERGFSATFFVTGDRVGREDGLDAAMIRDMDARGMEIGAHGQTHRFLSTLDDREHRAELEEPKRILDEITGKATRVFAPPGGRYDRRTVVLLRELSFDAMCTSRFGYNHVSTGAFELRRLPVTRDTPPATFAALIDGAATRLLGDYVRANTLDLMRRVLGERNYARMRSTLLGG